MLPQTPVVGAHRTCTEGNTSNQVTQVQLRSAAHPGHGAMIAGTELQGEGRPEPLPQTAPLAATGASSAPSRELRELEEAAVLGASRKRARRESSFEQHEVEMRFLLGCSQRADRPHFESGPPVRTMSQAQLDSMHDLGLAILVMASNSFDVSSRTFVLSCAIYDRYLAQRMAVGAEEYRPPRTAGMHHTMHQSIEIPLACFVMACKFVETFAPRLADVVAVVQGTSVQDLREGENIVLATLGWDIDIITGLDVLHKLLSFAELRRANQIKAKAELGIKVWCCNRALSGYSPADVAVGALLNACDHHELPEDFIDFVPPFMLTTAARDWSEHLKAFISEHVHPSKKVSQGG